MDTSEAFPTNIEQVKPGKTQQTRMRIVEVAQALFVQKGYIDTQMKDIAEQVGIGRKTLYRHFSDKQELGYAILEQVFQRIERRLNTFLDAHTPTTTPGELVVDALLHTYYSDALKAEMRFMGEFDGYYSGNRIPSDFTTRVANLSSARSFERLNTLIEQGQHDGSITRGHSAPLLLTTLHHTLKNLCQQTALRESAIISLIPNQNQLLLPTLGELLKKSIHPEQPPLKQQ